MRDDLAGLPTDRPSKEREGIARRGARVLREEPVWLLVALALVLAFPKALHLWTSDPIFSLGFLLVPWAIAWVATRPVEGAGSLWARGGLLVATGGLVVVGWALGVVWAALWALAAALALAALERGAMPGGVVASGLVVLSAPPPLFDAFMIRAQGWVAGASSWVLNGLGIPVVREVFTLEAPSFTFLVEPVCVGLSSLLATFALVGMVGVHARAPLRRLGAAFVVGVFAALAFNLVRVVFVVASAEWYAPVFVEGAFHGGVSLALGLLAFAVAVPVLGRKALDRLGEGGWF